MYNITHVNKLDDAITKQMPSVKLNDLHFCLVTEETIYRCRNWFPPSATS